MVELARKVLDVDSVLEQLFLQLRQFLLVLRRPHLDLANVLLNQLLHRVDPILQELVLTFLRAYLLLVHLLALGALLSYFDIFFFQILQL